jgi:F0F1-type ATP synthase epsilon subunit
MTDPITLDLVTPEKRVCQEPYTMIVLPGAEGEVGIRLYQGTTVTKTIPITGGFAEFSGEVCRVLADG